MSEKFGLTPHWNDAKLDSLSRLTEHELHIWWLPLWLDETQSARALNLLSEVQRNKYTRRATPQLKQNYLAGRYYLMNLLGAYTKQAANQVELSYGRLNKPRLSDSSLGVEFNFTDTQGYGVFVFSKFRQVGIDIESCDRKINFKGIADRRFTKQELDFVYQNAELNPQRCLSIWTRKEAYGKATGMGINFQMNQRNLYQASTDNSYEYKFEDDNQTKWRCLQLQLGDQFISSVVHEGHQQLKLKAFKSLKI